MGGYRLTITRDQCDLSAMGFRVGLRWKQGELGFEIRKGREAPFFSLAYLV